MFSLRFLYYYFERTVLAHVVNHGQSMIIVGIADMIFWRKIADRCYAGIGTQNCVEIIQ